MQKYLYGCLIILIIGCKEKYEPPVSAPATGYLVVEGLISANGLAEIHLTRTIPLADTARLINETAARIQVQGQDNSIYALTETRAGIYTNSLLNLNANQQYRLYIKTKDGKEYASDYVKVRTAPAIDSISWVRENDGVQIYINTHDPQNNTWYYRWETEETWEFHSKHFTILDFLRSSSMEIIGVTYRPPDKQPDMSLYTCWQYENSTNLLLGSSARLSRDIIHNPLLFIPRPSWKLSVLYSLKIKQYALSKEEYEFLLKMKRNSEETGSIFDRQPSELKGNIHCLTKPDELVIGFVGIANRQEKRIFIKNSEVPGWGYVLGCEVSDIPVDSAKYYASLIPLVPTDVDISGNIVRYSAADAMCVDCTMRGTNIKPSFWP